MKVTKLNHQDEIAQRLKNISEAVKATPDGWGHVGDLDYVNAKLAEIEQFLGIPAVEEDNDRPAEQ